MTCGGRSAGEDGSATLAGLGCSSTLPTDAVKQEIQHETRANTTIRRHTCNHSNTLRGKGEGGARHPTAGAP